MDLMRCRAEPFAVLVMGMLVLTGCSDETAPRPTPAPTAAPTSTGGATTAGPSTSPASPTPAPTGSAPASPLAGFSLDEKASPTFPRLGGDLGSTGVVRVGRHAGFDRVVWQFAGPGRPTYRVHYVDTPTSEGSGDTVQLGGDAYLEVVVTTVSVPDEGTARPPDPSPAALAGTVVAEADAIFGGFEGYGQSFVGVRGRERPFRVTVLGDPTRLVVDVATG